MAEASKKFSEESIQKSNKIYGMIGIGLVCVGLALFVYKIATTEAPKKKKGGGHGSITDLHNKDGKKGGGH